MYLWDFFYEKGRDEHGTGAGRSNLDILISGVLDTYPQNESRLNEEQRRVLKVVLMMQAISRRINNAIPLLRPTEANVKLAFEGDDSFSTSPALILKNQLVTQLKILFASEAENHLVEYATATVQGDQPKIDELIARIKNDTRTGKLVSDARLSDAIKLNDAETMRFRFTSVTIDDFTRTTNRLADQVASSNNDFHIYGVICFVKDEAEQIGCNLQCSIPWRQVKQTGCKVNHIAICMTPKAMKAFIDLHAWIMIRMEWTSAHAISTNADAIMLCCLSGGNCFFH